MADPFSGAVDSVIAPATKAVAVVPHDMNALGDIPKALYIGTGGHLVLRGVGGGADVTFRNIADGTVVPVRAQFVRAAGTTAADIVALY